MRMKKRRWWNARRGGMSKWNRWVTSARFIKKKNRHNSRHIRNSKNMPKELCWENSRLQLNVIFTWFKNHWSGIMACPSLVVTHLDYHFNGSNVWNHLIQNFRNCEQELCWKQPELQFLTDFSLITKALSLVIMRLSPCYLFFAPMQTDSSFETPNFEIYKLWEKDFVENIQNYNFK